jgi:hypothetical protein
METTKLTRKLHTILKGEDIQNKIFTEYSVNQTCKNLAKKQRDNFNKRFNQCQKKSV